MTLQKSINRNVGEEWMGNIPPPGQVIEVENPADFSRLFSSVLFIYCQEPIKIADYDQIIDDREAFGVGFLWGGCTILHLLSMTKRFMMLDFSYHVLKLNLLGPLQPKEVDVKKKKKNKEPESPDNPKIVTSLKNAEWAKKM